MPEQLWQALKQCHARLCIDCEGYVDSDLYDKTVALIIEADRRFIGE